VPISRKEWGVTRTDRRVFAVGLDGATLDLIRPWAAEGKLPNLARILNEGSSGTLRSTIPPVTGPAWVSFMTGRNPGKHGVGDFLQRTPGQYQRALADSRSVRCEPFWVTAGRQGKKVGIVNVPVTYPPYEVNGFLISGLLTPRSTDEYAYPSGLVEELRETVGGYRVNLDHFYSEGSGDRFLADLRELVDARKRAVQYLMERYEWDFFMVHFIATDWVQHFLWHCMDPTHPRHNEREARRYGDAILEIYQYVDGALGELVARLDRDTVLLVMSDHGFGPFHKYVYLNNWLLEKGLLFLKKGPATRFKYALFRAGLTPSALYQALARLKLVRVAFKASKKQRYDLLSSFFLSSQDIDWHRTRAYASGNIGQVFVNVKGRESHGIVEPGSEYEAVRDRVIALLGDLKDPETGVSVIEHIYRREEIYNGPYVDQMADILFLPTNLEYIATGLSEFVSNAVIAPSFAYSGTHRMEGVFAMWGDGIKAGLEVEGARITDMAPTLLHLLGLPVSSDMDGRVLTELMDEGLVASRPVRYSDEEESSRTAGPGLTEEEAEEVRDRLRGLGYVT
jgi:predicted AlkP superfamily phosphohydrolase/phosphomutase